MKSADNSHNSWFLAGILMLGAAGLGWSALSAMRSGTISVKESFLGFDWWDDVTRDDQPIRFWGAVLFQCAGAVGCLVGLILLLICGF
jgi:hypothetical protein